MSTLASRRRRSIDFWPGFVDALSSLLMVLVFVLMIFTIGQFVLSDALSGRDKALAALNLELAQLAKTLSMEKEAKLKAENSIQELSASLASTSGERDALRLNLDSTSATLTQTQAKLEGSEAEVAKLTADINALAELRRQLESEIASKLAELEESQDKLATQTELSAKSAAQVELLNRQMAALRTQLAELSSALDLAKAQAKAKDVRIEELGKELNLALANKVNELQRYRSDFFGKLRGVLGSREDVRIVGDRFVFQSEVLFASGEAEIGPRGREQLAKLARTLKELAARIPPDIPWVLQVDGHTDKRPINTSRFPSNWELSTARAISVARFLISQGIPSDHVAARGLAEFQPLDDGETEDAYRRNRRIEIKLTSP